MYGFEYPRGMTVGRVCLELSLKPFKRTDINYIEGVCAELFAQWNGLLRHADGLAVMLWTADGSEILTYGGRMEDEIEWARYLGLANPPACAPPHDPARRGLHTSPRYYTDDPAVITYGDLKNIVAAIKRVGKRMTGFDVSVGATFDPGPEFAISEFKFKDHREISSAHAEDFTLDAGWVRCTARLNAERVINKYAAYPGGIPDGLHIGTFLGAQYRLFARDVGFDYIWFSNGFGYSRDSWSWTGECYDGKNFAPGAGEKIRNEIIKFWDAFAAACPGVRVETRGSNLTAGTDIASHGTPLSEIYARIPIAPPNSPWAALDAQFGLELAGFMSHIAETPEGGFLYRYYTHDPWWVNSPWFDRYDRQPHDIYLPLSIARLDAELNVTRPYGINFLTADDSFGNLPWRCPNEVIPHVLEAYLHYPDETGPVTWVYPFAHYHAIGCDHERAGEALFGDWFIKNALDEGTPLGGVISDINFVAAAAALAKKTVAVLPVPDAGSVYEGALFKFLTDGGDALLYGPVGRASEALRELIGVTCRESGTGEFIARSQLIADETLHGALSDRLLHTDYLSGGGVDTRARGGNLPLVTLSREGDGEFAYATYNPDAIGGRLAWARGSFPSRGGTSRLPENFDAAEYVPPGFFLRAMLQKFGVTIIFTRREAGDDPPMLLFSRSDNAYYISAHAPDTTARAEISLPDGAPVMTGADCVVNGGSVTYSLPRWLHSECRTFVRQKTESRVSNRVKPSVYPGADRRMYLYGLVDADVIFYAEPGKQYILAAYPYSKTLDDNDKYIETNVRCEELGGGRVLCRGVTGSLMISWGGGETYKQVYEWNVDMSIKRRREI